VTAGVTTRSAAYLPFAFEVMLLVLLVLPELVAAAPVAGSDLTAEFADDVSLWIILSSLATLAFFFALRDMCFFDFFVFA
jgi:hypothetical protein